jgi:hypothetical protein
MLCVFRLSSEVAKEGQLLKKSNTHKPPWHSFGFKQSSEFLAGANQKINSVDKNQTLL